ncbi:MAG: glycosyltransferase family 1 protein [bacterium]|nr:glycosyltransferase family 1 protein [bacterium]
MKIGIDARFYGPIGKGLGRYTQEIVDNIIKLDQANEYVIFLRRENFDEFQCAGARIKKVLADIKWYGWAEQLIFPVCIWRERVALMHFTHFNVPIFCPVKFIVTIHDLILIKFPTARATTLGALAYKTKNLAYKIVITLAVRRAKKVLAVSEYTKQDLAKQFKIKPDKIAVTHEGVAELNPPAPLLKGGAENNCPPCKGGIGGLKPYLLYVGNAYPHKNLEGFIRGFAKISQSRPDLKLILVGKEDYFYSRLKQFSVNFSKNIIFPGYVPDSELAALYRSALAYVFPSFYEGFGLPPLEAMSRGLPVVSSNKTCLPEVLGAAALYFNPDDEADMIDKIKKIINDENLRANLRGRGYEQIKKYSWESCARQTLAVYKNIL